MPGRSPHLPVRDPDVFLLLPATPFVHRHARILRTILVDHTIFCFRYPDLHHRLLAAKGAKDSAKVARKPGVVLALPSNPATFAWFGVGRLCLHIGISEKNTLRHVS